MKKFLKIFAIIVIVLVILLAIYYVAIHFDGFLNKENKMTQEEIVSLLEKGREYPNYYYGSITKTLFNTVEEPKTEYYTKDNIVKVVNNGQISHWTDFNNGKDISLFEGKDGEKIAIIGTQQDFQNYKNEENQMYFDYSLISNPEVYKNEFKYLGEKEINNRKTIIVQVSANYATTKFYIDKDTGLIMKRIDFYCFGLQKVTCDRNVKLDIVTDEDIKEPNTSEYKTFET